MKAQGFAIFLIALVAVFIIGMVIFGLCVDQVEPSHLGVMVELGQIKGVMQPGIQWTGPFTDVHQYDLRLRKITVDMKGDQSATDKDGQSIYATIEINYRLNPENIRDAYSKVGADQELAEILNVDGIIREAFKSASVKYTSLEVMQKRPELAAEAMKLIGERFPQHYFILDNVVISNVDFNPGFKSAIETRKTNEELAKAETEKVNIIKSQAEQLIEQRRGQAESAKLDADSKAYAIERQAEAEALALRLKKQELNELLVENNRIDMLRETWNGQLPVWVTGENANLLASITPPTN